MPTPEVRQRGPPLRREDTWELEDHRTPVLSLKARFTDTPELNVPPAQDTGKRGGLRSRKARAAAIKPMISRLFQLIPRLGTTRIDVKVRQIDAPFELVLS